MTFLNVPLADLKAQYASVAVEIEDAIRRVIDSTRFINGPEVTSFEDEFAVAVGAERCVGVASGTGALMLALKACDIGVGDEVIVPSHTFAATAEAVAVLGATPIFVDIEAEGYGMDPDGFSAAITDRTKAVIPVHIYGHPADMTQIGAIASANGIFVIEDAAQAHLAKWDSTHCGSIGDLACFSFFPGKNLGAYGDAGGVTGKSGELINRVRQLRDHGRSSKYVHEIVGYGERLDALQAAILRAKLPHLDEWTKRRNLMADRYRQGLVHLPLELPSTKAGAYHAYHLFVLQTDRRDEFLKALNEKGIGAGIHYPIPLHLQPAFKAQHSPHAALPRVERVAERICSLPLFPEMTEIQQDHVMNSIEEILAGW